MWRRISTNIVPCLFTQISHNEGWSPHRQPPTPPHPHPTPTPIHLHASAFEIIISYSYIFPLSKIFHYGLNTVLKVLVSFTNNIHLICAPAPNDNSIAVAWHEPFSSEIKSNKTVFNSMFRLTLMKTSKLRISGLLWRLIHWWSSYSPH